MSTRSGVTTLACPRHSCLVARVRSTSGVTFAPRAHRGPPAAIEAAVVGGGKQARVPHDAWITADPFKDGFRVLITGPQRFERTVVSAASSKKVRRSCYVPSVLRPRSTGLIGRFFQYGRRAIRGNPVQDEG